MHIRANGYRLPSEDDSEARGVMRIGKDRRNDRNTPLVVFDRASRSIEGTTPTLPLETSKAIAALLNGLGHVIDFNDGSVYSSRGVGPSSATTATATTSANAKFGSGYGTLRAAAYDFQIPEQWTVFFWISASPPTWNHFVARWDGGRWSNGVRNDLGLISSTMAFFAIDDGVITFAPSTLTYSFDNIVVLPFHVPDDMIAAFYDFFVMDRRPFPPLPQVEIDGSVIAGRRMISIGSAVEAGAAAAGKDSTRRTLDFVLAPVVAGGLGEEIVLPKPSSAFSWAAGNVVQVDRVVWNRSATASGPALNVQTIGRGGGWAALVPTAGQYLTIPYDAGFAFTGDVSFAAWVWWDGTGPATLISNAADTPVPSSAMGNAYEVGLDATGALVMKQGVTTDAAFAELVSKLRVKRGAWSLVVAVRRSREFFAFVDGVVEDVGGFVSTPSDSGAQASIMSAKPAPSSSFAGYLGPIALWGSSLTPQAAAALWHAGVQSTPFPWIRSS